MKIRLPYFKQQINENKLNFIINPILHDISVYIFKKLYPIENQVLNTIYNLQVPILHIFLFQLGLYKQ